MNRRQAWVVAGSGALMGALFIGGVLVAGAKLAMGAELAPLDAATAAGANLVSPGAKSVVGELKVISHFSKQPPPAKPKKKLSACPDPNMVLVEGNYCPNVVHRCAHWMESKGKYAYFRCAEYSGATCKSKSRVKMRYCIDRDEYVKPGESLPASHQSWTDAKNTCESLGKRVCLESEWNFACEGEEMRPYPYGWKRDADACNADRTDIFRKDGQLKDLRMGAKDKPRCVSPFGVHNLSGNLEEFVTIDRTKNRHHPHPAMKGAYWQPSRNHCRAAQTAHDRFYNGTETGFRCCADARK